MIVKKNSSYFVLLIIVVSILSILPFMSDAVKSWLDKYKDLAGWFQALYSVGGIAFAVGVAYLPIAKAEAQKNELRDRSLVLFLSKYDSLIATELVRAKDAQQHFSEIEKDVGSALSRKKYSDFIERIVYMEIESVHDEGSAFDYSASYFKDLIKAKSNIKSIRRRIENSDFGSSPIINDSYVKGINGKYDELIKIWYANSNGATTMTQLGLNMKEAIDKQYDLMQEIHNAHTARYGGLGKYFR